MVNVIQTWSADIPKNSKLILRIDRLTDIHFILMLTNFFLPKPDLWTKWSTYRP